MRTRRPTWIWVLLGTALVVLSPVLAGCGSASSTPSEGGDAVGSAPNASASSTAMPTAVPAAEGLVRTLGLVTILGKSDEPPMLCLGGVAESLPPQCDGPELQGFDWADHRGGYDEASGVRWGEFAVTGRFDGKRFEVTRVVEKADFVPPELDGGSRPDFSTRCPEPAGGWRVLDPDKTTQETVEATFAAAERLPGYSYSWVDHSRIDPDLPPESPEANDPRLLILNVRVTEDPDGAETALRETWGGALCVTKAQRTLQELQEIQQEVNDLPGMLTSGQVFDSVEVGVIYDDGSLQRWADATYGEGVVQVIPALVQG